MDKNNSLDKVVSQVDHLTPEELLYLKEAMDNPELVNALWASDYEEIPVDIETFITNKRYLGSSFIDDEGKSLIYKFWRDELKNNIFNPEKPIYELALSGCLSGDTKLKLLDREVTIEDLYYQHIDNPRNNGKDTIEYTYSYDMETNKIVVGEIVRVFTTGINDLYEITLDNGEKIKCTPDHKFLCRDKHYRTINHGLEVGTSLMPFNCDVNEQGYERIQHPGDQTSELAHKIVMKYKYGDNYKGVTHHKDYYKLNNHPSNLLRIRKIEDHGRYHANHNRNLKYYEDKFEKGLIDETQIKYWRNYYFERSQHQAEIRWSDPIQKEMASKKMTERNLNGLAEYASNKYWNSEKGEEMKIKQHYKMMEFNKNHPNIQNCRAKASKEELIEFLKTVYNPYKAQEQFGLSFCGLKSLFEYYEIDPNDYIKKCPIKFPNRYWGSRFSIYNKLYNENGYLDDKLVKDFGGKSTSLPSRVISKYFEGNKEWFLDVVKNYNHKIVSIKYLRKQKTYNITVRRHHNYTIGGIISGNCIGSGKSTVADVCMAYILYKLLCLRDPAAYYKLTKGSRIALAFFNLGLDQAYSVGWSKLQSYLKASPWFLEHGTVMGRTSYETYYPGKDIRIVVGSKMEHFIGLDIFCLTGDTLIDTENGPVEIKELQNNPMKVYNSENVLSDFPVYSIETMKTSDLIEIELENGEIIRCTPNHKFMLKDGIFKEVQYLTEDDELEEMFDSSIGINSIKKIKLEESIPVYDILNSVPTHDFQVCVGDKNIISHNCAFMDEIDYAKGSSMTDEQSKMMKTYSQIRRRMESRYMRMGVIPGMMILVSSKNSEDNFLEQYINANRDKPHLHIVDEPLWVVKGDQGLYSGKKFLLAVGNKYRPSKILSDSESRESYENNGQRVIEVPIEHKEAFEQSMNQALMDIAGIAISSHSKYLSYNKIKLMYRDYLKNPFVQEVIELGFDDDSQLMDYLDEKKLSKLDRSKPHFVHWDASVTGDGTGLGMTTILSTKNVKRIVRDTGLVDEVNDIVHKIVFGVRIRAKEGEEIPFYKIRNFIYYLRDKLGYNIVMVSQDSFQSRDSLQTMKNNGFNTKLLSVDRTYDPYNSLKNAINEGRIVSPHIGVLEKELLDLEDDRKRNKIDHPQNGCFPANTIVMTDTGYERIIDLKEGIDKVYAYDVHTREVKQVNFCNLRKTRDEFELYKIQLEDGSQIRCTGNHPILTQRDYVCANELTKNDYVKKYINDSDIDLVRDCKIKSIEKKILDKPIPVYDIEVPYYSNFILGNGCIVHNSKDVSDTIAACVYNATQMTSGEIESRKQAKVLAELTRDLHDDFNDNEMDITQWR